MGGEKGKPLPMEASFIGSPVSILQKQASIANAE
jgi:hypothetical protein